MVRVVRLRFLSIVNGFNCLVCVRRLLPLIPPPRVLEVELVLVECWFSCFMTFVLLILYNSLGLEGCIYVCAYMLCCTCVCIGIRFLRLVLLFKTLHSIYIRLHHCLLLLIL